MREVNGSLSVSDAIILCFTYNGKADPSLWRSQDSVVVCARIRMPPGNSVLWVTTPPPPHTHTHTCDKVTVAYIP